MADDWIGVQEAAELLDVSRQMVHKLITSKELLGQRLSERGAWMLHRRDVLGLPKRQVLDLAGRFAKSEGRRLRHHHDLLAVLDRLDDAAANEIVKAIWSVADREKKLGHDAAATAYSTLADSLDQR